MYFRTVFNRRKVKTKVTTRTNRDRRKQHNETIRAQSKYMRLAPSQSSLLEKVVRARADLLTNQECGNSQPKQTRITFNTQLKPPFYIDHFCLKFLLFSKPSLRQSGLLMCPRYTRKSLTLQAPLVHNFEGGELTCCKATSRELIPVSARKKSQKFKKHSQEI